MPQCGSADSTPSNAAHGLPMVTTMTIANRNRAHKLVRTSIIAIATELFNTGGASLRLGLSCAVNLVPYIGNLDGFVIGQVLNGFMDCGNECCFCDGW